MTVCAFVLSLAPTMSQDEILVSIARLLLLSFGVFIVFSVLRHQIFRTKSKRSGLLTRQNRPPLTEAEIREHILTLRNAIREVTLAQACPIPVPDTPSLMAQKEIVRLSQTWANQDTVRLSDDELRSINLIFCCGIVENGAPRPLDTELEAMIGDHKTVNAFRERVKTYLNDRNRQKIALAA